MKIVRNKYGRVAHSSAVLPMLGLARGGHLPKAGMPPREVQGVLVWVEPAKEPTKEPTYVERWGVRKLYKSSAHRVMCKCPECGKTVSLGRLAQHAKVHA